MEGIDTLATQKSWAQGSLQKPFTSIVTLYMHEQLALEHAVRELTGVINNIYYGNGNVDDYLLDLWLTILHTSKKLPRPTTSPPDLPTPSQSRLLTLLSTLRQQPNPIPRPQIDTQNPIPDDPFKQQQPSKRITWTDLPQFMEGVKLALHDEPGRASGFSELEAWAWEDLVAFLALCARDQIGGLDAVAVRMLKGALEEEAAAAAAAKEREKGQIAEAVKLNVYVAAAALWAVIMGEELWERQGQTVESPVGLSLEPVPEIPAGKISKPRWRMWIDRFQFMSLREDLRMSTRELAAEAAAVMLRVV
ncbi:hypothetical protein P170DRAFT_373340 [Aspergillus steynii IBT 23096]|uniref:Uncharacterized protein n=1 Tax=Aspergillus steynii IBT 23096 TaxID=1392250 RepID=A0A2I2GN93_9EURO|nr:uncharacterized protein P170DRAFT_373340 [Aspergillus steynii IBT 23096]PLB54361.1 hypothetical protein P170DRAFT_373340 [Aspergillus steynii IBT 23096]